MPGATVYLIVPKVLGGARCNLAVAVTRHLAVDRGLGPRVGAHCTPFLTSRSGFAAFALQAEYINP